MAATAGDAGSTSSGIYPCDEGHESTEVCPKCMYREYRCEPVFQKILSPTDIQKKGSYKLYIPKPHAARFCPLENIASHEVTVYDVQMKRWPMFFRRNAGNVYLTGGWSRFAQGKRLSEGDTITFYKLNCPRGAGTRVFMIGVSYKGRIQILGAPVN
jgi:hypothetical protein